MSTQTHNEKRGLRASFFVGVDGYRFGFQGQETDGELYGETNAVNYKYRMHDPRVGRFLSIDPLAADYPHNSPYAFSENRVIDGIELEGLEYLDWSDARINIREGKTHIKIKNLLRPNRNAFNWANGDSRNWVGSIGLSTIIGEMKFIKHPIGDASGSNNRTGGGNHNPTNYTTVAENAASTGRPDRRVKPRTFSASGNGSVRLSKGMLIADAVKWGLEGSLWLANAYDENLIKQHSSSEYLGKAMIDVNFALNIGMIPEKFQNTTHMSDILNVVLQGESETGNMELYNLGMRIYDEISTQGDIKFPPASTLPAMSETKGKSDANVVPTSPKKL